MPEAEITPVKRTRAPRKQAASSDVPKPRAPRRTVARKATPSRTSKKVVTEDEVAIESPARVLQRKAPTPLATDRIEKKTRKKQLLIASLLLLVGVGASAAVGFSDTGQIDVNKTIEDRNDRITSSSDNPTGEIVVPVQNTSGEPNGGMRGRGVGTRNVTPPVPVEGASSTEATASTTDTVPATEEAADVENPDAAIEEVSVE